EMEARIARHRAERSDDFTTIEEPVDIAAAICKTEADVIVVDCLTLWLSNFMLLGRDVEENTRALCDAAIHSRAALILVTNEVGCGIVPESALGRDYRDRAGILNQRIGAIADEVYWMVFGHPLRVK